jgi:Xaa-Pro aminopeptidase
MNDATANDWRTWLDVDASAYMPAADHAARRSRLHDMLGGLAPAPHSAALLVTGSANVRWLTGFTGSFGALLLTPDDAVLLTDARYAGRVGVECKGLDAHITRQVVVSAVELAADAGVDRLCFEGDHVSYRVGTELQTEVTESGLVDLVSVHGVVERHRTTKDDAELARLARACAVTEDVLDRVLTLGLPGRTEREVARLVEQGFRNRDAEPAFRTIVATGTNGAVPHHEPTTRVIAEGELVTIDCGARVDGYHADTTRTVAAGKLPSGDAAELVAVFDVVAEAQERGVAAAVDGTPTRVVDAAARDHVVAAGHGDQFVHGTGHGVGLEIHEAPAVSATASATLEPRTVLTIEPGIYLPGRGGVRIEDTVLVTDDGPPVRLTTSPHDLLVV